MYVPDSFNPKATEYFMEVRKQQEQALQKVLQQQK